MIRIIEGKKEEDLTVSDGNKNSMNTVIFSINIELGENNAVLSMKSAVGNPVFVWELCRAVDGDCVVFFVVNGSGFHLYSVVPKANFGQTKATDVRQIVDSIKKVVVALSSKAEDGSSE